MIRCRVVFGLRCRDVNVWPHHSRVVWSAFFAPEPTASFGFVGSSTARKSACLPVAGPLTDVENRNPPFVVSYSVALGFWSARILPHRWMNHFERIRSIALPEMSRDSPCSYDAKMNASDGSSIHVQTGNAIDAMPVFPVPGGTLITRFRIVPSSSAWRCSHIASRCQFQIRFAGSYSDHATLTKPRKRWRLTISRSAAARVKTEPPPVACAGDGPPIVSLPTGAGSAARRSLGRRCGRSVSRAALGYARRAPG